MNPRLRAEIKLMSRELTNPDQIDFSKITIILKPLKDLVINDLNDAECIGNFYYDVTFHYRNRITQILKSYHPESKYSNRFPHAKAIQIYFLREQVTKFLEIRLAHLNHILPTRKIEAFKLLAQDVLTRTLIFPTDTKIEVEKSYLRSKADARYNYGLYLL